MTEPKLSIIGVFKDGEHLILVDASGKRYACTTPQELWDDTMTVIGDRALPGAVTTTKKIYSGDKELLNEACDQIGDFVRDEYGGFFGRIASEASRKIAPFGLKTLRNISKRDRFGIHKKVSGSGSGT